MLWCINHLYQCFGVGNVLLHLHRVLLGLYQSFSYLRQENSTRRGVPTFSVWYRAWLSGTGCPVLLLFIYVSDYDVATQSVTFPATSDGFCDVKKNIIGMFLFKMHISTRYEKNNQVPVLDPDTNLSLGWYNVTSQSRLPPRLVFVTSYHPWLRFVSLDPTLVLDSIILEVGVTSQSNWLIR